MLSGIRKATNNWLGRTVVVILFGMLILSFAVWGIGDIFQGGTVSTAARVGETRISVEDLRRRYTEELQQLQRRTRGAITAEQARAFGLDRQVLDRMVNEATLDEASRKAGMNLSAEDAARLVAEEPTFRSANGSFNREAFNDYLRETGLNEVQFIEQQRRGSLRQYWIEGLAGGVEPPKALQEALHRFEREERDVRFLTLGPQSIAAVTAPDAATLQAFFDSRKAGFRAPAYRRASLLVLQPGDFADEIVLSDQDLRLAYDRAVQGGRLGRAERRRVQQLVFPTAAEAEAAAKRLSEGLGFEALGTELKLAPADMTLGLVAKSDLVDPAVAEAAFALAEGAVSPPVAGRFGTLLLRVEAIEPGTVPPFDSVRELMRADATNAKLATDRGIRDKLNTEHDRIEDLRGAGKPLADVSRETGRALLPLVGIDQNGLDRNGAPVVGIPDLPDVVRALFASDVGVDNEAVRTRDGGYVWFEITGIEPARERTLDEVKNEVEQNWTADETARRLAARAGELITSLAGGTSLDEAATTLGISVQTATGVTRNGTSPLGASAQASLFSVPVNTPVSAASQEAGQRLVIVTTTSRIPPFLPDAPEANQARQQLSQAKAEETIAQFLAVLRRDLGANVDARGVSIAIGGAQQP